MILSRVANYMQQRRRASLTEIAQGVGATAAALQPMLAVLERKGRVRRLPAGSSCGQSCCKCDPATLELYEWVTPVS